MLSVDQLVTYIFKIFCILRCFHISRGNLQIQENCSSQGQPIPGSGGQLAWNIPSVCRQANPWPHPDPPSYSTFAHQASTSSALNHPRVRWQTVRGNPYAPKSTRIIQTSNPRLCPLPCLAFPMKTPKVFCCIFWSALSILIFPYIKSHWLVAIFSFSSVWRNTGSMAALMLFSVSHCFGPWLLSSAFWHPNISPQSPEWQGMSSLQKCKS